MDLRAYRLILRYLPVLLFRITHQSLLAFLIVNAYYHTSQQNCSVIRFTFFIVGVDNTMPIQRETDETNLEMVRTARSGQH